MTWTRPAASRCSGWSRLISLSSGRGSSGSHWVPGCFGTICRSSRSRAPSGRAILVGGTWLRARVTSTVVGGFAHRRTRRCARRRGQRSDGDGLAARGRGGVQAWSAAGDAGRTSDIAGKLGVEPGMVVQELGWDSDVDEAVRDAVEERCGDDLLDEDADEVVDARAPVVARGRRRSGRRPRSTPSARWPTTAWSGCSPRRPAATGTSSRARSRRRRRPRGCRRPPTSAWVTAGRAPGWSRRRRRQVRGADGHHQRRSTFSTRRRASPAFRRRSRTDRPSGS